MAKISWHQAIFLLALLRQQSHRVKKDQWQQIKIFWYFYYHKLTWCVIFWGDAAPLRYNNCGRHFTRKLFFLPHRHSLCLPLCAHWRFILLIQSTVCLHNPPRYNSISFNVNKTGICLVGFKDGKDKPTFKKKIFAGRRNDRFKFDETSNIFLRLIEKEKYGVFWVSSPFCLPLFNASKLVFPNLDFFKENFRRKSTFVRLTTTHDF